LNSNSKDEAQEIRVEAGSAIARRDLLTLAAALGLTLSAPELAHAAAPAGKLTWGVHVSLAPTWFDPAETQGIITPYMVMYALHDAMVKPMPGNPNAPSLASSYIAAEDGLSYEFVLREAATFHNGDPVTSEDVKFSFERYRGSLAALIKERVASIETPDARHVVFKLKTPWPDFLMFYSSATGAGWVVPKKYLEKVGDDGFKAAPIGAGPYKFVSFKPGIELELRVNEKYWRKTPSVETLVFRSIPEQSTRLAALKGGEIDILYWVSGELAEELRRSPGLTLKAALVQTVFWLYFPEQFDPKSPWHDERVRRAASLALDRPTMNEALTLGFCKLTNNIVAENFEYYAKQPTPVYDVAKARQLLAEAGHPNGIDAGPLYCDAAFSAIAEAVVNGLADAGIRVALHPIERAGFYRSYAGKQYKGLIMGGTGAFGNAASRMEAFVVKGGTYAYGNFPDIDELFQQQAGEMDAKRRGALLAKIQDLVTERTIYAPIWQLAALGGIGPRVGESAFGLIAGYPWTSPYEDITMKQA
jgi:peptide/nickel transport system substrate-binding protein